MSRSCDNCGKPTVFGVTYCPECERVYGDHPRESRAVDMGRRCGTLDPCGHSLEIATIHAVSRLIDDLVDNLEDGTKAAERVADWLAAKYGSRS